MVLVFGRYLSYFNGAASYLELLTHLDRDIKVLVIGDVAYKSIASDKLIRCSNRVEYFVKGLYWSLRAKWTVSTYGPGFLPYKNINTSVSILKIDC